MQLFKPKEVEQAYYPNNIGGLRPANEFDYEFLIVGKDIYGAPFKVINAFLQHYVGILSIRSNTDQNRKEFSLALLCDLEDSDLSPKDLIAAIRSLNFVTSLESYEMKGRIFGKAFPLTFYDKRRVVALGSTTLIKLAMRLARETGATGTSALYEEGRDYAKEIIDELKDLLKVEALEETRFISGYDYGSQPSLEAYCVKCKSRREIEEVKQVTLKNNRPAMQGICPVCGTKVFKIGFRALGAVRNSPLIENMQGFLMAAGWGTFELRSEIEGRSGEVTILDPPTFEGDLMYGNQFVEGIAAGFLEKIIGTNNKMRLVGEKYLSKRRILRLHFAQEVPVIETAVVPKAITEERRLRKRTPRFTQKSEETERPDQSPNVVNEEVERIIQSLEEIEASANKPQKNITSAEAPQEIVVQEKDTVNS